MTVPAWHEEPVAKKHDRKSFDCGQHELNEFLTDHARQSHERGAAKTFLGVDDGDGKRSMAITASARHRSNLHAHLRSCAGVLVVMTLALFAWSAAPGDWATLLARCRRGGRHRHAD